VICGVFRSLQLVSWCLGSCFLRRRPQEIFNLERRHPLPDRQAAARRAHQEIGEGAPRRKRTQESSLVLLSACYKNAKFLPGPNLSSRTGLIPPASCYRGFEICFRRSHLRRIGCAAGNAARCERCARCGLPTSHGPARRTGRSQVTPIRRHHSPITNHQSLLPARRRFPCTPIAVSLR